MQAHLRQRLRPLGCRQLVGDQLQYLGACMPTHVSACPCQLAACRRLAGSWKHSTCRGKRAPSCPKLAACVEGMRARQLLPSFRGMVLLPSRARACGMTPFEAQGGRACAR